MIYMKILRDKLITEIRSLRDAHFDFDGKQDTIRRYDNKCRCQVITYLFR